jgi:hypothetical protein
MSFTPRSSSALALALTLGVTSLAGAQPVQVKLEKVSLEEGRAGTVRVRLTTGRGESRPVLLLATRIELRQQGAPTRRAGGKLVETIHALSLESSGQDMIPGLSLGDDDADRVVSVELRAIDDPGAAARLPMPEHVSTVRGVPHRLVPLLERRALGLSCQPRAGMVTISVSWEAVVVPKETPRGIYALDRLERWKPEVEGAEPKPMGPRKVFRLTTRHWRAWRGPEAERQRPKAAELLLQPKTFEKLPVYRGSLTRSFRVRPAVFGRKEAVAQAGFDTNRAWRLPDDRWILQGGSASKPVFALVGPRMKKAVTGRGDLSQIARDLSEGRPARLYWATHRGHPDLAVRITQFFGATHTKGRERLTWQIELDQLQPFLDGVLEAKLEVFGSSLLEPRQP